MPEILLAALGTTVAAVGTAGVSAFTFGNFAMGWASVGAYFLASTALSAVLNALTPKPDAGALTGSATTVSGGAQPFQVIYGKAKVGSAVVFSDLTGNEPASQGTRILHRVQVFAGHEVESFEEVYIDDKKVLEWDVVGGVDDGTTGVTDISSYVDDPDVALIPSSISEVDEDGLTVGDPISKFAGEGGYIKIQMFSGKSDQVASQRLIDNIQDAKWTSNHRLRGLAYFYCTFSYNRDKFESGLPEITSVIKGKKVYDPRDVAQDVTDSSTWEWSDNPALCLADYLISDLGLGESPNNVDYSLVNSSAVQCDVTVSGLKKFTCNGSFTTNVQPYDLLSAISSSMGGLLWYAQGEWRMKPAYWTSSVKEFDEGDLRSGIQMSTRHSSRDNFNKVAGTFRGPETKYVKTEFPAVQNLTAAAQIQAGFPYTIIEPGDTNWAAIGGSPGTAGVTFTATGAGTGTGRADFNLGIDAGQESVIDLDLPFTNNSIEARRLSRIMLERNRQQLTISATFSLKALGVQVGDVVSISNKRFGWTGSGVKTFEVVEWTFSPEEEGGVGISLSLREVSSEVFDENDDGIILEIDNSYSPFSPFPYDFNNGQEDTPGNSATFTVTPKRKTYGGVEVLENTCPVEHMLRLEAGTGGTASSEEYNASFDTTNTVPLVGAPTVEELVFLDSDKFYPILGSEEVTLSCYIGFASATAPWTFPGVGNYLMRITFYDEDFSEITITQSEKYTNVYQTGTDVWYKKEVTHQVPATAKFVKPSFSLLGAFAVSYIADFKVSLASSTKDIAFGAVTEQFFSDFTPTVPTVDGESVVVGSITFDTPELIGNYTSGETVYSEFTASGRFTLTTDTSTLVELYWVKTSDGSFGLISDDLRVDDGAFYLSGPVELESNQEYKLDLKMKVATVANLTSIDEARGSVLLVKR
jgi:hypothetical protein